MKLNAGDLVYYAAPYILQKARSVGLVFEVYERDDRVSVLWFERGHRGLHDLDCVEKVEAQSENEV